MMLSSLGPSAVRAHQPQPTAHSAEAVTPAAPTASSIVTPTATVLETDDLNENQPKAAKQTEKPTPSHPTIAQPLPSTASKTASAPSTTSPSKISTKPLAPSTPAAPAPVSESVADDHSVSFAAGRELGRVEAFRELSPFLIHHTESNEQLQEEYRQKERQRQQQQLAVMQQTLKQLESKQQQRNSLAGHARVRVCEAETQQVLACYRQHMDTPLACQEIVKTYAQCAQQAKTVI